MSSPITRAIAAELLAAAVNDTRRGEALGLHARVWVGSGNATEQPVHVYILERVRKVEKRYGREVTVQRDRSIGHVALGKDGRVWLSSIVGKAGRIGRLASKALDGVEVEVDAGDGRAPMKVMRVRRGMGG